MKKRRLLLIIILSIAFGRTYGQSDPTLDIGTKSAPFSYTNTVISSGETNTFSYQFTISTVMDITISHCESTVENTGIFLLNENEDYIDTNVGSPNCSNPNLAHLEVADLQPGTYYVWIDWPPSSIGNIVTVIEGERPRSSNPEGNTMSNAINMGVYSSSFLYTDTKDTNGFTNDYQGRPYSNDVFYQFTLSEDMNVVISHCGSSVSDSYVWLLDSSGNRIGYNDDYSGIEACSNNKLSYLDMPNLAAGTYYVVSEGNFENGEIITQIKGTTYNLGIGSTDQNYILTRTYMSDAGTAWQDKVDYFDGLGRPEESALVGSSPAGSDLVTYQEYDGVGRESNSWLPVVLPNNNGTFASLSTIKSNMNVSYPDETKPYTLPVYEASPLNRVLEQYGPGQAWQNNSRSAKTAYLANISDNDTLNCIYYKVEANSTDTLVTITYGGSYETAQLYVIRSTDEDGNASFEFKDKQGQVVLTRQIVRSGSTKTMYDTYYIYDDFGNLTAVLPPLASDEMKSGTSWTNASSAILRNYAYLYLYDGRNRCKGKRLPGCSWNYYVYDTGDRLIFSQDGEQRKKGEWTFTLPDVFGRTCVTGICKNSFSALSATPPLKNILVKAERDNTTGTYKGYALSGITLVSPTVLNVSYYDDYAFMGKNGIPDSTDTNFHYEPISGFGIRYEESTKTLPTGTLTAKLDGSSTPTYLYSVMYYDNRDRVIQTKSNNHLTGGIEKDYVAYNFTGQPTKSKHIHFVTGKDTQTEIYSYTYDHAGRLITTKHKLNTGAEVILAENTYDELGRLKTNKKNNQANLNTTYAYNVRSWMKSSSSPLFSQTLYYNDSYGSNTPRYNGNISAMSWTTSGDKTRGYNFVYDNLSRLTAAGYLEGGTANTSYGTSYAYDKHGNMIHIIY
ncbi:MAG: hypothetical protein H6Q13_2468 [Bacteroidetes bacterium]|nr:hypothetical protein [Bacteroidota bacterium]